MTFEELILHWEFWALTLFMVGVAVFGGIAWLISAYQRYSIVEIIGMSLSWGMLSFLILFLMWVASICAIGEALSHGKNTN